jgi:hypothetical protein
MNNPAEDATAGAPRRTLFGRVAAGAMALGIAGFAAPSARADTPADGPDWPGKLTGRHRQAFDGYTVNGGSVLLFAHTFRVPRRRSWRRTIRSGTNTSSATR